MGSAGGPHQSRAVLRVPRAARGDRLDRIEFHQIRHQVLRLPVAGPRLGRSDDLPVLQPIPRLPFAFFCRADGYPYRRGAEASAVRSRPDLPAHAAGKIAHLMKLPPRAVAGKLFVLITVLDSHPFSSANE